MFWESFSFFRVGSLMPSDWGQDEFIQIHCCNWKKVIPGMWKAFPDGGRKFLQDLAPGLSSKKWKRLSGNTN